MKAGGKLHRTAKERIGVHDLGQGLQQADVGISLHPRDHPADRFAFHQAVGVQNDGQFIGPTGFADEVFDVAGLAPAIIRAAAIENAATTVDFLDQSTVDLFFDRGIVGVAGVRQDRDIGGHACGLQRLVHCRNAGKGRHGVFVADGD